MGWHPDSAINAGVETLTPRLLSHAHRIALTELSDDDRELLNKHGITAVLCNARVAERVQLNTLVGGFLDQHAPEVPLSTDPDRDVMETLPPDAVNPLLEPMRAVLQAALNLARQAS